MGFHTAIYGLVRIMSYVYIITEQGPRSILQSTLMSSTVQDARKHRAQGQLILHRGIIKAPTPATTVKDGNGVLLVEKKTCEKVQYFKLVKAQAFIKMEPPNMFKNEVLTQWQL